MNRLTAILLRLAIAIVAMTAAAAPEAGAATTDIPRESLSYKVMYKWGLIHKKAGWARLTYTPNGATAKATLYAGSEPWADKIYYLRDTLTSKINTATMTPTHYERLALEDGKYSRDVVRFTRSGNTVKAVTETYRRARPGDPMKTGGTNLTAEGITVDMISAFYYVRSLPFDRLSPGQQRIINIFSAKKKERLTITFHGTERIEIDKQPYDTYRISFRFTTDGGRQSSDNITTWVETAAPHRPVKLEGKLKVGKILCLLEN